MPQLQTRSGGGDPSSLEMKAANSLYRFAATVDEGAAGRPEVQEGRAGCSGRSGLATGTENRREMKRGKRKREIAQQVGMSKKREGRRRVGQRESFQVTPLWREVTTGGPKAADAANRGGLRERSRALGFGKR